MNDYVISGTRGPRIHFVTRRDFGLGAFFLGALCFAASFRTRRTAFTMPSCASPLSRLWSRRLRGLLFGKYVGWGHIW